MSRKKKVVGEYVEFVSGELATRLECGHSGRAFAVSQARPLAEYCQQGCNGPLGWWIVTDLGEVKSLSEVHTEWGPGDFPVAVHCERVWGPTRTVRDAAIDFAESWAAPVKEAGFTMEDLHKVLFPPGTKTFIPSD